jgi:ectoine hydroxylase-related dioxygenase (phytanoyl-CoA dioxygenase family)
MATAVHHGLSEQLDQYGFVIVPHGLDTVTIDRFKVLLDVARCADNAENVTNSSGTYGLRNLTDVVPEVAELVRLPAIAQPVTKILGAAAFMTRATLFDKTPGANWGVFWHQDLSIAVETKHQVSGFGAWTRKAGVACVQPPVELMTRVLAVRLHLDDCTATNGALKVLPGTHRGRMSATEIDAQQQRMASVTCEVPPGGLLLMKPLLLHASSSMDEPRSRRVIHFEFANFELPLPLQWKYQIACCGE